MKKHNCLLLILTVIGLSAARAQTPAPAQTQPAMQHRPWRCAPQPHRWSFNGSAGLAFPAGPFAHTAERDVQSGFVHSGRLLELSGVYRLNRSWGITLLAGNQYHNSDSHQILVPGPQGWNGTPAIPPQHWNMTRILAGGVYTFPLNRKNDLTVKVRGFAGVQKTHTSEYSYTLHLQYYYAVSTSLPSRNLGWAFSYQADAGLQWQVYRHWSVFTFAGYNGCRPSYNQDITPTSSMSSLTVSVAEIYKKIDFPTGSILLRAGVGYDL